MTFLITSNTTDISENPVHTTGMNAPQSYVNTLSQTIEVEPNSEIAVDSIKFTRNGNVQVDDSNNQFAIYIGRDLNGDDLDLMNAGGFPNRTWIQGGKGTSNPKDLAERIKYGLYNGLGQHPNFVPIADDGLKVELKNGSGAFTGFKYSFSQNLSRNASGTNVAHIPAVAGQGGWVSTNTTDLNCVVSASGSTGVILKKQDPEALVGDLSVIGQKYPLNLANGSVVFTYNSSTNGNAGDLWEVGLTRATINEYQAHGTIGGTNQEGYGMPGYATVSEGGNVPNTKRFFDYSVASVYDPTAGASGTGAFVLKVFDFSFFGNVVSATDSNDLVGTYRRREVDYGTHKLSASFVGVKFLAKGDNIQISVINSSGAETVLVNNSDGDKVKRMKNLSITTFYLFPKVNIYDDPAADRIMVVDDYDGLDIPTPRYSDTNLSYQYGGRVDSGISHATTLIGNWFNGEYTFQDFQMSLLRGAGTTINSTYTLCEFLDARNPLDMSLAFSNTLKNLNVSGGVNKNITIVTASDGLYNGRDTAIAGGWTRDCGAQNIFGFEQTPTQTINTYQGLTQGNLGVIESKTVPQMTSNKSLFIRIPDLPIESFNTGKGGMSKILFHLPRFDNAGNDVGGLFFKSPEKLYIPINNPQTIRLNSLKVEICNVDERTEDVDIVGQTIITFDIRKRR